MQNTIELIKQWGAERCITVNGTHRGQWYKLASESVNCYFNARSRAWVAAGWHDADIEAGGKTVHALIKELLQCTQ